MQIELIQFGDFECPDCAEAYPLIKQWKASLGDQLTLVFKQMPMDQLYPIHPHATMAARASEAARLQNSFWEMHDMLYQHQDALEEEDLVSYAELLGLDAEQFEQDFESAEVIDKVQADFEEGKALGVTSTPTFIINGDMAENSRDYVAVWSKLEELAAA